MANSLAAFSCVSCRRSRYMSSITLPMLSTMDSEEPAARSFFLDAMTAPQGDRPLPAPREAGPWAPAFGGAGLGRLGEWRPPGPSRFRFRFCFFFLHFSLLLCGTVEPCD